jgi:hypothetical protein
MDHSGFQGWHNPPVFIAVSSMVKIMLILVKHKLVGGLEHFLFFHWE